MRVSRRRSLAVSLTVCSALVAGCGSSGPKLEHADGAALISLVHRIVERGRAAVAPATSRGSATARSR